jgi:hypothetical protein
MVAEIEDLNRLAGKELAGEDEERHVRPPPWTVHREKSEPADRQAKQMGIGVRQQFVCLLGRAVKAHGVINRVFHVEGQLAVRSVDGA